MKIFMTDAFVEKRTEGFEELKKIVAKYTPAYVEEITGIPQADLADAARIYANARAGSICYCMGITQHTSGTDNVKSLANLAMLCGHMGVEGGGVNPLRGQNNVQGACDMGGLPNVFSGYQPVTDLAVVKEDGGCLGRQRSTDPARPDGYENDPQGTCG